MSFLQRVATNEDTAAAEQSFLPRLISFALLGHRQEKAPAVGRCVKLHARSYLAPRASHEQSPFVIDLVLLVQILELESVTLPLAICSSTSVFYKARSCRSLVLGSSFLFFINHEHGHVEDATERFFRDKARGDRGFQP